MFKLVVVGTNLEVQPFEISSQLFDDASVAHDAALRWVECVPEMAGLLDWKVVLYENGRIHERWCLDDAQSEYEHRMLTRDNFEALFQMRLMSTPEASND